MGCPNSTAGGCQCVEHAPGLMVHAQDVEAYQRALAPLTRSVARLSVVTLGPTVEQPCTGGMLCSCPACTTATQARVKRGGEGGGRSSPFKVRRAA